MPLTRDELVQIQIIEDAESYGRSAEAMRSGMPLGITSYVMGFHNGLLLAANVPGAAESALANFMNEMETHKGTYPRAAANQEEWFESWRKIMGPAVTLVPSSDVKGGAEGRFRHPIGDTGCPDFPGLCEGHPREGSKGTAGALDETRAEQR